MPVIKIGGCNGSGKTSVVRTLLAKYTFTPQRNASGKICAYLSGPVEKLLHRRLIVLGSYESVCGGMDTISDKERRLALLKHYAAYDENIVVYEGLITGKTYGAMGAFSEEPEQFGKWLYVFMDTPFEVCVERVLQRRRARLIEKHGPEGEHMNDVFDPERTMRPTYKGCQGAARIAAEHGHEVLYLDHTKSPVVLANDLLKYARKYL